MGETAVKPYIKILLFIWIPWKHCRGNWRLCHVKAKNRFWKNEECLDSLIQASTRAQMEAKQHATTIVQSGKKSKDLAGDDPRKSVRSERILLSRSFFPPLYQRRLAVSRLYILQLFWAVGQNIRFGSCRRSRIPHAPDRILNCLIA